MLNQINEAVSLIHKSTKTIALTGAGVSTESGIPDFRSASGLWSKFDPMEYGTLGAFKSDPEKVWKMLAELIAIDSAKPNTGHKALASLEKQGLLKGIITQNIDMLHQKAGNINVVEFHGSINSFTCLQCGWHTGLETVNQGEVPPRCKSCQSILKPDIVFFDEQIPQHALSATTQLITNADLVIVAGTSCQVAPAAQLPHIIKQHGGAIIEINKEPALSGLADIVLAGSFSKIMTALIKTLQQ